MKIVLTRIDDRFIHGQVLTKWMKQVPVKRVIVANDEVANDDMRKTLVLSVAPANIPASAVTIEKMVRVYNNPKYADTTVMLLVSNPADILYLVENGVDINTVNVGGIRFSTDKVQVTKSVSVTEEDITAFKALAKLGVKLEFKQVPENQSEDFSELLENAIIGG